MSGLEWLQTFLAIVSIHVTDASLIVKRIKDGVLSLIVNKSTHVLILNWYHVVLSTVFGNKCVKRLEGTLLTADIIGVLRGIQRIRILDSWAIFTEGIAKLRVALEKLMCAVRTTGRTT